MITRPLELESRLSPPPRDLDFVAWVNVGVIVLFFALLGSRFVLTPGVPVGGGGEKALDLPLCPRPADCNARPPTSVVLSYRRDNVILFEGGVYKLPELREALETYAKQHPGKPCCWCWSDRQVSTQAFSELCEAAKKAGFANVVAAAEPAPADRLK